MVADAQLFETPSPTLLYFRLWAWMKGKVYKRKVHTQDELLSRILNAVASIKKREDQLRQTTCDLCKRVAKPTEVDSGIFGTFVVNYQVCHFCVTNLSLKQ
jgi:hypothetical protein